MGGRSKRDGMYVNIQLIHVVVQQKSTEHGKAIIFQLKKRFIRVTTSFFLSHPLKLIMNRKHLRSESGRVKENQVVWSIY